MACSCFSILTFVLFDFIYWVTLLCQLLAWKMKSAAIYMSFLQQNFSLLLHKLVIFACGILIFCAEFLLLAAELDRKILRNFIFLPRNSRVPESYISIQCQWPHLNLTKISIQGMKRMTKVPTQPMYSPTPPGLTLATFSSQDSKGLDDSC